jgi:hypothetical protein
MAAETEGYEPGTPSTYLFDTGTASAGAIPAAKLDPQFGWRLVAEDDVRHKFRGDAVVLNDHVRLVFRASGGGVEVYSQSPAGLTRRATLTLLGVARQPPTAMTARRIVENGPAAVDLVATFAAAGGGTCQAKYRLTAGQMIVEVRPQEGTAALAVQADTRYMVVPDFFAQDMVFGPTLKRPRLRLPAETMLLQLLADGHAQLICVWQSSRQEAVATASAGGAVPGIGGCEIQAAADKPIWVACLEAAELWHEESVPGGAGKTPAWTVTVPAKWRADLLQDSSQARSWWFQGWDEKSLSFSLPERGKVLVYALDRSQATPLTTFTPIDVLRNTLGVGPCQYILQTEKLAADANPTPDYVMTWCEKQFSRNRQKKAAADIREQLTAMVEHLGHVQQRIEAYQRGFAEICRLCDEANASTNAEVGILKDIVASSLSPAAAAQPTADTQQRARQLADQVAALTGKERAAAECEHLGTQLRALGAAQDRLLASCRMQARWLKQSAAMLAEDHPDQAVLADKVRTHADRMLK